MGVLVASTEWFFYTLFPGPTGILGNGNLLGFCGGKKTGLPRDKT